VAIVVGTPVFVTNTADLGPAFTFSLSLVSGRRYSFAIATRDTTATIDTAQWNGTDDFDPVEAHPEGSNIVHLHTLEGVATATATADLVVTFSGAIAAVNVVAGIAEVTGEVPGAGWRDAAVEAGSTTGPVTDTSAVTSATHDLAVMWTAQRGTATTTTPDVNTTELGQQQTGSGSGHLRLCLWTRAGASPTVALGGTWNSSNGHARIAYNVNIAVVPIDRRKQGQQGLRQAAANRWAQAKRDAREAFRVALGHPVFSPGGAFGLSSGSGASSSNTGRNPASRFRRARRRR